MSSARERRWGLIGGAVGSLFGAGSAAVAVWVDGASPVASGPYPDIFQRRELLAMDVYLLFTLVVGAGFCTAAVVYARKSPYPRSDTFGATLVGGLLTTLAGLILFVRVYALLGHP